MARDRQNHLLNMDLLKIPKLTLLRRMVRSVAVIGTIDIVDGLLCRESIRLTRMLLIADFTLAMRCVFSMDR